MKKRILASIICGVIILTSCGFAFAGPNVQAAEVIENSAPTVEETITTIEVIPVVSQEKIEEPVIIPSPEFNVEVLTEFVDENIDNYTTEQLKQKIADMKKVQEDAHNLAESARALGWPETSSAIKMAQAEWANAKLAIEVYQAKLSETEYPAASDIWNYMKDLGWNDYVCAGIMGNLMAEVGGQTLDIQYWLSGNGYYGMCQWNRAYCEGVWGANLAGQCDFLRDTIKYEIDTFGYAYQKGFNFDSFLAMTNERDVALAFAKCYERCSSASYTVRQNNAEKAYDYFVNN